MTLGLNLHSLARGAISSVHPEVPATLYRAAGQVVGPGGEARPIYAPGEAISVQAQSEGPGVLAQVDRVGQEEVSRKLYLYSEPGQGRRVAGIVRPLSRGGDMIFMRPGQSPSPESSTILPVRRGNPKRALRPPTMVQAAAWWWLVEAVIEDFSLSGWVSVRATLQVKAPDFSSSPWYTEGDDDGRF